MPSPFDQSRYQVRLEHGTAGLRRLAASDVVVVVDVLAGGGADAALAAEAAAGGSLILRGDLRTAGAVARAVLAEQQRRGSRTSVAIVTVDAADDAGAAREPAEDRLGAGAVVDALAAVGIDHTSPEAAVACEAFRGLRGAVRHLLTASGTGQELVAAGRRDDVLAAAAIDADDAVAVWRDGRFEPR